MIVLIALSLAAPLSDSPMRPATSQVAGQEPPITVTFVEEPLANVLHAFADYANESIIASSEIRGIYRSRPRSATTTGGLRSRPCWRRTTSSRKRSSRA